MSEEDFLGRWSRRKREAQEESVKPPASQAEPREARASAPPAASGPSAVQETSQGQPEEEFDLSTLPPIDSITAATDVTQFLRSGVPLELTRAALRRAWETDPAIRDFVGLAENAWDFNDPNAMAGFGALDQTPEQVRELVARIVGGARRIVQDDASPSEPQQAVRQESDTPAADDVAAAVSFESGAASERTEAANKNATTVTTGQTTEGDAASHNTQNNLVKSPRGHGGALPR